MSVPQIIVTIIVSCLGSSALFGFIQFLISRRDKKKNNLDQLIENINALKKSNEDFDEAFKQVHLDTCRLQLMNLIHMAPKNVSGILELGKHYFVDLDGDSFLSTLFSQWLRDQHLEESIPDWFKNYEEADSDTVNHSSN